MTTIYLLAHQDDEMGVLPHIAKTLAEGRRAVCIFVTDGAFGAATASVRNAESQAALTRLGVPAGDIVFLGDTHAIPDGRLVETMDRALDALKPVLRSLQPIDQVIIPAWEGGHHDHDALHLIGRAATRWLGVEAGCRQFSLYRAGSETGSVVFGMPRHASSADETIELKFTDRLRYLFALRHYRSQLVGLLRLIPRIARYMMSGKQVMQPVPHLSAALDRPADVILYEQWGFYSFDDFARHARPFVERNLVPAGAVTPQDQGLRGSI